MKKKIIFLAIIASCITMLQAQDYYPLRLGNEWVFNVLDVQGTILGVDTGICENVYLSGDTTFYLINNYVDSLSGGESQMSNLLFNGIADTNAIYRKATNINLLFKHSYVDGESYGNFPFDVTSYLIGNYVVGADTFPDCYYVGSNNIDSTGGIFAPNIGPIGLIENSVLTRELKTQNIVYRIEDTVHVCQGDSILIHSQYQKDEGIYTDSLIGKQGGDSILVTSLIVDPVFETAVEVSICDNESYFAGGELQNTAGTYYDTLSTVYGCDSIVITNLSVNPIQRSMQDVTICEGEEYFAGGANQTNAGTYYDTLSTSLGCDSIIITNLSVSVCTGFDHNSPVNKSEVYPNPTTGMVFIDFENLKLVEVYNLLGSLVLRTDSKVVDLSHYPEGIYYFKCISSSEKYLVRKVVYGN